MTNVKKIYHFFFVLDSHTKKEKKKLSHKMFGFACFHTWKKKIWKN